MKVLVIGQSGQLAQSLIAETERIGHPNQEYVFLGRDKLDLRELHNIESTVLAHSPNILLNTAAYTAVDNAENDTASADLINTQAPERLARATRKIGARFIQISTDYVYDGKKDTPYTEKDTPNPTTVYGKTKLAGELRALNENPLTTVVRTAWLYSSFGSNFIKSILTHAKKNDILSVVSTEFGSPTSATDLANALYHMIQQCQQNEKRKVDQLYHCGGTGYASWYDLASQVLAYSKTMGGPTADILPISSEDWQSLAVRPASSQLNSDNFYNDFSWRSPHWQVSVAEVVSELLLTSTFRTS